MSWLAFGLGLLAYLGWILHVPAFASLLPGQATMKAHTALCCLLLGAACVLRQSAWGPRLRWSRILAGVVLVIAGLTLVEHLSGVNLGIDEFPLKDELGSVATGAPGRMSASTAFALALLSAGALFAGTWSYRTRRRVTVTVLALALSIFLSFPFGLAYGINVFSFTGMSLNSSVLLLLLSVVHLLEIPERGWVGLVTAPTPLGESTRRVLATVLLVPFLLGWVIFYGESRGLYGAGLSRSLYAVVVMLLLAVVVIRSAVHMQRAETAHRLLRTDFETVSQRLSTLVENSPAAIFIKTVDGRYEMVNSHFEQLVQRDRSQIIGRRAQEFFREPLLTKVLETDRAVIRTKGTTSVEIVAEVGGARRVYLNTKFPLSGEGGEVLAIGGIWTDITEQKQLSETLQDRNVDLERSNQELEQFAYVASHDLQEPLRMVSSYMQLLEARYKGKLDDDAKEFIDFAVDGAARMQSLIQDLLAFSRVGTRGREPEPVDAGSSLDEALHNLQVRIQEHGAQIQHDPLPVVFADPNQLTQVFQNLVGNAIKFRGEGQPSIRITVQPQNGGYEFAVSDNGIGFDQKHAERIFVIFQRLNSRELYEGTGIGLAICKKIVERHGGRMWAESQPGQGATFRFTLPRPPQAAAELGEASEAGEPPEGESVEERAGRMI